MERRERPGASAREASCVGAVSCGESAVGIELDDGVEGGVEGRDAAKVEFDEATRGECAVGEGVVDGFDGGLLELERES